MFDNLIEENSDIGMVWEALIRLGGEVASPKIINECGLDSHFVRNALVKLRECGLVERVQNPPTFVYKANVVLDALAWARAIEIGVSLDTLEAHAFLNRSDRNKAIDMATNGILDEVATKMRIEKMENRERVLTGRAASIAAATDLAKIVSDAQTAVDFASASDELLNSSIYVLLQEAQGQTKTALDALVKILAGK